MREGWELKKLKEVCRFQNGFAFKSRTFRETGTPVVRITNIQAELVDLRKVVFIDRQDYDKDLSKYEIINGDLLIAMSGATTGKIGIHKSDEVLLLNQRVGKFEPLENLEKQYLFYFLSGKVEENLAISAGSAQPNLSTEQINNFEIPIPPLKEQKQIVALLDKAFTAIEQAKANIEKNIANAKELFQSKLNDIFSQKGAGWEEKSIDEISTVVNGYSFKSKDFSADNEIKSIKITNVGIMEFVEDSSNNLPSSFLKDYSKVKVHEGDLVLALTRTIISGGLKVARVPESYHNSLLNQRVAAIVPNLKLVNSDYLYYYFSSDIVYNYVLNNVNTLMQPNLSIKDLKRMPIPITSIDVQERISVQIEDLSEKTNSLVNSYEIKLNDLEELKKSILQKAFAGELTNQSAVGSNEFAVNIE